MISIQKFAFNPFMENTYVLFDETKHAVVVDPGCYEAHERKALDTFISENELTVDLLLNTHCHIDHVLGNSHVKSTYKVPLLIHEKDLEVLNAAKVLAPNYGMADYQPAEPDRYMEEGETITFGNSELKVVFVPGHAPGHVAFINEEQNICIGGDVLFKSSIGRTDLPGGDFNTLISSIQEKLFTFSDDMIVYPGHGPETTIGEEKRTNPFCAIKN
ncbi:MBL fold metallo-hydrolase [Roseivirga sp. BDSF3-8]|uniref:MBL fold metallo-hydrolase n=1 Tax=Roseivirga sp. BDSF3-8 TaxID=3241598 RepID=UPI003531EA20